MGGLRIVKLRAEVMQAAADESDQAMLSVAGLERDTLDRLCAESSSAPGEVCAVANDLFPSGFSCAGTRSAIEQLQKKAQEDKGLLQCKLLKTSGAFHTSLMQGARQKLLDALKAELPNMKPPRCNVYMNLTGAKITPATRPADIIPMLGDQVCNCVRWRPSMLEMIKEGVTEFYECGPMKQLKAMMKR